jgi:PrtD family type I secretion system ABC transporter
MLYFFSQGLAKPVVGLNVGARASGVAHSELSAALRDCRAAFVGVGITSGVLNVLMLTGSFFMLEVYDRVIPSRSMPTLVGLGILAATLYAFQAALDALRGRILVRIGAALDERLSGRVHDALIRFPLKGQRAGDGLQPLRDLDAVRAFLSGLGPTALFDLPWMPLYLGICYAFHPLIGIAALIGGVALVALTFVSEVASRDAIRSTTINGARRNMLAEACRRNAELLQAMGMRPPLRAQWAEVNANYMYDQRRASDLIGTLGAISKVLRLMLQSAVLGVGACLVINQEATAGIIIAGSILTSRALAPAELAIANWRVFVAARQSWGRLRELLRLMPALATPMALPAPRLSISVEGASVVPPAAQAYAVKDISFQLAAGQALGVIGPTGSGKSSLARLLANVWEPAQGKVRLDGAVLDQWCADALGKHVGYLPQDVELLDGTVAQNIARFDPDAGARTIAEAALAAHVHDLILRLPSGYETGVGEAGVLLSAGQRQRVGLARALYGAPFLVVLDEPNSNLDAEGDEALTAAILGVRKRGGIVIVIAHRPTALAGVDQILVLGGGRLQAFGPKDEVLGKVLRTPTAPMPPKLVPEKWHVR